MNFIVITNDVELAKIATHSGVGSIMIDLETLGKKERQGHKDTLISDHSISDINKIKEVVAPGTEIIVRINPVNPQTQNEIKNVLACEPDFIMLPMFTTIEEVKSVLSFINKRCSLIPLVENRAALDMIQPLCNLEELEHVYLGLNDLQIDCGHKFLFEAITLGYTQNFIEAAKSKDLAYGFGGVAHIGAGLIPAELILTEHERLGTSRLILSRAFAKDKENFKTDFDKIKDELNRLRLRSTQQKQDDHQKLKEKINQIVASL